MTKEEAIDLLDNLIGMVEDNRNSNYDEALKMAIKALEQEPCCNCIEFKRYAKEMGFEIEQEPVFDKIKAEIESIDLLAEYTRGDIKRMALAIIDKYKAGSEE